MPTDRKTVDYIVDQIVGAGAISARAMFGEYGLYCNGKMIAVIGDEQLFMKWTAQGRAFAPDAAEVPPYPGAKPCLLIDPDLWEDQEWLSGLAHATAAALPVPKAKAGKRPAAGHRR